MPDPINTEPARAARIRWRSGMARHNATIQAERERMRPILVEVCERIQRNIIGPGTSVAAGGVRICYPDSPMEQEKDGDKCPTP
jgi:hypothetical protein